MKRMKILKFAALMLTIMSVGASCTEWLDVKPRTEKGGEDMFSTLDGFKEAIAGAYTNLTAPSLYGRDMTFGVVGVLGQEWSGNQFGSNTTSPYRLLQRYDYTDVTTAPIIDAIWDRMYNAIANLNTIIEYTDKNRSVLTDDYYEIIRGEALALRAFMHFDLLRLYGKYDFTGSDVVSIPYVRNTDPKITPQSTNANVITYILEDIDDALDLLVKDPIYTGRDVSGYDYGYLARRQYAMNYYAALALRARVCLWVGRLEEAKDAAEDVIEAQEQKGLFRWVTIDEVNPADGSAMRDRTFSTEHVFALNATNLYETIQGYFTVGTSGEAFQPFLSRRGRAYYASQDYRHQMFDTENSILDVPSKFRQYETQSPGRVPVRDVMPMIRISEMYYIAAEYYNDEEGDTPTAAGLYNTVQIHRGLPETTIADYAAMRAALSVEYEREFLGEGQLFFWHKRHATQTIYGSQARYIVPIPALEIERGKRVVIE